MLGGGGGEDDGSLDRRSGGEREHDGLAGEAQWRSPRVLGDTVVWARRGNVAIVEM